MHSVRINKWLSQHGIVSRRQAEHLIKNGEVEVNNQKAVLGQLIGPDDLVKINGQIVNQAVAFKYYLLNKPKQTVCTLKDNFGRPTVIDLIAEPTYLFPVGRLDYNTTGVLLLTNDGELAQQLLHPKNEIERVYRARLNVTLSLGKLKFLNGNKVFLEQLQSRQLVEQVGPKTYLVHTHQGSYHHIKKLFALVQAEVVQLKRVQFAFLTCEKLMVGQFRPLKLHEIKKLKALVDLKNKTKKS